MNNRSGKSLINGNWIKGNGNLFSSFNPSNGEKLNEYNEVDHDQIDQAVKAALVAYPLFKSITIHERSDFLNEIANQIENLGNILIEVCDQETGLGTPRLLGERGRTVNQLRMFATLLKDGSYQQASIDTAQPERSPLPKADIRKVLMPIGPVAVFSASNFPLAFSTLGGDTASALAAGNPVVIKGHPSHPYTTELCSLAILKAIDKLKLPKGIFNMIQGKSPYVSEELVKHDGIEAVGFTGSTKVGRILYNIGASRKKPIPVYAEMGSSNPIFIFNDVLTNHSNKIAQDLAGSITLGTGQFCTKPGLIVLEQGTHSESFITELVSNLDSIDNGTLLNENIYSGLKQGFESMKESNVETLTGGDIVADDVNKVKNTLYKISAEEFLDSPSLEEEIFGPAALLIVCKNNDQLLDVANSFSGHLTASIMSNNSKKAYKIQTVLEDKVGRIIYNGYPTGVEVCHSMHHGGPYPSSTCSKSTSVGTAAITRFCKVVCYQNTPQENLPLALQNSNPLEIFRLVNGKLNSEKIDCI